MPASPIDPVDRIRAFNRFYTKRIGVLGEGLLATPFSLTEARILYEIAARPGTSAGEVRQWLGLDAGYLSRLLARLEADGLVEALRSADDARRRTLRLTSKGGRAFASLEAASRADIEATLATLDESGRRQWADGAESIMAALSEAKEPSPIVLRTHRPGDMGWIVERHAELYAREYSFDSRFEALVAEIAAAFLRGYDPAKERCFLGERDGVRLGSVVVVRQSDETAKLRMLLVEPEARGSGLGRKLLGASLDFAREAGYRRMTLWTNSVLGAARHLYETTGFVLESEAEHADFGPVLTGQTWTRQL